MCCVKNHTILKPFGGLWASPIDAENGWIDWCRRENFRRNKYNKDHFFLFSLENNANVVHIYCREDLFCLPRLNLGDRYKDDRDYLDRIYFVDYKKALQSGVDAIELHLSQEKDCDYYDKQLRFQLSGWDCDCIFVMNADVVVPYKEKIDLNKLL